MASITKEELIHRLASGDIDELRGHRYRVTKVRVHGKEVCMAHIIATTDSSVYHNLGLHIGVHEGEDHTGEAIGMIRFTPWEAVVVAADVATKAANIEIGFMDRFCGTLIILGRLSDVKTAVEEVIRFFRDEIGFVVCDVHTS